MRPSQRCCCWAPYWSCGGRPGSPKGPAGFVSGNGRIEATEIAIATKTGGRVAEIRVNEGDLVQAGQVLARMELDSLRAQREEAVARLQQAQEAVANTRAAVALRESDHASALAVVAQRESELDAAQRRLPRSEKLAQDGFYSSQVLDDDRARVRTLEAALKAARSQAEAPRPRSLPPGPRSRRTGQCPCPRSHAAAPGRGAGRGRAQGAA